MHDSSQLEHLWFADGGVRLHAAAAGPSEGPLVILLHGFPEFWYSWRKQIEPLARAGFRVVAPDQRGYNLSSKPPRVVDYALPHLVSDVLAIADQLQVQRFYLAGHDWGAAVGWAIALQHPQRLHKLAILNVPHPAIFLRTLKRDPRQMLRSWYMAFFQLPKLPVWQFSARNFEMGVRALVASSRGGTFTPEDLDRYREAWSNPGTVTAMINWYRAAARHRPHFADRQVHVPIHILWGKQDKFLIPEMAEQSLAFCDSAQLTYFPEATHWLHHEEPETVNRLLIDWFKS